MRKLLALLIVLLTFPALAQTAVLTWALPTARTDGSALPVSQIGSVLVQQNGATAATLPGAPTTYTTGTLAAGTYEYDVIVCDTSALCSMPSAAASVTVPLNPPSVATDIQLAYFPRGTLPPAYNTQVFDCTGFGLSGGTSGNCGVGGDISGGSGSFGVNGTTGGSNPALVGSAVSLVPAGCGHCAISLNYQSVVVNVQKFQATFSFVPNGWNVSFVLNNTNNQSNFNGATFSAGAGCEGGFFQGFNEPAPPNNLFALMLDQYGTLMAGGNPVGTQDFTYSSVQYYQGASPPNAPNPPGQSPCNPDLGSNISGYTYVGVNKTSTSPVPLNSPAGSVNTTTGDTYSVTVTYDGSNLSMSMHDVTNGGSCTPITSATCFSYSWSGVNIPSMVGGNTAWVSLVGSTNGATAFSLLINSITFYTP